MLNFAVHDLLGQAVVFCANALTQPVVAPSPDQDGQLCALHFSCVLGNPPFGAKAKTAVGELVAGEPLVIPDRLLGRAVLVPGGQDPLPLAA